MSILLSAITGTVGVAVGAVTVYVALRKDEREARSQAVTEAEKTVELLEKQNEILERQAAEEREARKVTAENWRKRETEWKTREEKLERRIDELERDYRNLVLTVTAMGFCANASTCPNNNPGDRRARPIGNPGGTD